MKKIIFLFLMLFSGFSFAKESYSNSNVSYSCTSFKEVNYKNKVNLNFEYLFNGDGYPIKINIFNLDKNIVSLFANVSHFNGNFSTYEFYSKNNDYSLVSSSFNYSNMLDTKSHNIMILKDNNLIYTCE